MNESNERALLKILKDNRDTEFGKKYRFDKLCSIKDYQDRVPLSTYADYEEAVSRMMDGEQGVLTNYPVAGYCQTSGTENHSKYIPYSMEQVKRYDDIMVHYVDDIHNQVGGKRIFINCLRLEPEGEKGIHLFTELYYRELFRAEKREFTDYVGGKEVFFQPQQMDNLYVKAWLCLVEEDITTLESIYLYDVLILFNYIENNWMSLLRDIRAGEVTAQVPKEVCDVLLAYPVSEQRLLMVEKECRAGFDNIVTRLWPGIRLLVGISAEVYFAENTGLDRYAKDVSRYHLCYAASESVMGLPDGENSVIYRLQPQTAVYEFLPVKKEDNGSEAGDQVVYLPDELQVDHLYEPVITNYAGLYRYRMGDVLKCEGVLDGAPLLRYVGRRQYSLNVSGEKMDIAKLEKAIAMLQEEEVAFEQYCFTFTKQIPTGYVLVASVLENKKQLSEAQIADFLDRKLRAWNVDYEDLQNLGTLDRLQCIFLSSEQFRQFREKHNLHQGHGKPKHILMDGFDMKRIYE